MRIPGIKIWRAFEQLDHLSDDECNSLIRRAYLQVSPWRIRFLATLGTLLGFAPAVPIAFFLYRHQMFDDAPTRIISITILGSAFIIGSGVGYLLARDLHLYLLIRRDLHRASCPKCKQSLIGLPVLQTALHPGTPGDARVRCAECGREWVLMEIGLTARDLIPFEQRVPDERIGTVRRGDTWKGHRR